MEIGFFHLEEVVSDHDHAGRLSNDDWASMYMEALALRDKKKVAYTL